MGAAATRGVPHGCRAFASHAAILHFNPRFLHLVASPAQARWAYV
jgi:hypothetical protein